MQRVHGSSLLHGLKVDIFSSGGNCKGSYTLLGVVYLHLNDYIGELEWDINVQQVGLNIRHRGQYQTFSLPA